MAKRSKKEGSAGAATAELPPMPKVDPEVVYRGHDNLILISEIKVDPSQHREAIDLQKLHELAVSIATHGLQQPVGINPEHRLIFGHRRVEACKLLGLKTIPIVELPATTEEEIERTRAAENLPREALTPIEEALLVDRRMRAMAEEAAKNQPGAAAVQASTAKGEVAAKLLEFPKIRARAAELVALGLCKPVRWVRERMYLLRFGPKARDLIASGKLPLPHARIIARVADPAIREQLAYNYAAGGSEAISDTEPGRLELLQDEVSRCLFRLDVAPWKLNTAVGDKPPCLGCRYNSATNPGLFDGGGLASTEMVGGRGRNPDEVTEKELEAGICTLHSCYAAKLATTRGALADAAKKIVEGKAKPAEILARRPFLDAKALDRRVRERKERAKISAWSGVGAASSSPHKAEDPKQRARAEWNNAMWEWRREACQELDKLRKTSPATLAALLLFCESKHFSKVHRGLKLGPETTRLLKAVCKPTPAVLAELAGIYNGYSDLWEQVLLDVEGALELLVQELKLRVKPAPKPEDFLPKTPAASKTKPAKGRASKKKAKKGPVHVNLDGATAGKCGVCGCTEDNAREDPDSPTGTCSWVNAQKTLCSRCAKGIKPEDLED